MHGRENQCFLNEDVRDSESFDDVNVTSMEKQLQQMFDKSLDTSNRKVFKTKSLQATLRSELKFWHEGGSRGPILQSTYMYIFTL